MYEQLWKGHVRNGNQEKPFQKRQLSALSETIFYKDGVCAGDSGPVFFIAAFTGGIAMKIREPAGAIGVLIG